jgi:hypothetical protein
MEEKPSVFGGLKNLVKRGIDKFMNTRISPDEQITLNALDSFDPFSRPGQTTPPPPPKKTEEVAPIATEPVREEAPIRKIIVTDTKPKKSQAKKKQEPQEENSDVLQNAPEVAFSDVVARENPIQESRSPEGLPSYRCEFSGRDVFVGFPCYKTTNPVTAFAMIAMALDFGRDKIRFDMSIGDAMIYHSRNVLAQKFLETDAKYLLMIDDDIIPCIGRPAWMRSTVAAARNIAEQPLQRHVIHRLVGSGKTLIGGAYFGRQEGAPLMCSNRDLASQAREYRDFYHPVDWVGTGCILIHRKVFEDIEQKFPELNPEKEGEPFDYFHPIKSTMGEDVSFCHRAKIAGHQPFIDLGTPVFHVGYKTY